MIICRLCPGAVPWGAVHEHLLKQHGLLRATRQLALASFEPDPTLVDLDLSPQQINVASLPDGSLVEPTLPVMDGFRCNYCDYTTLSRELVAKHLRKFHCHFQDPLRPDQIISREYHCLQLQCWRPASHGKPRRYWSVRDEPQEGKQDFTQNTPCDDGSPERSQHTQGQQANQEIYYQPETLPECDPWHHRTGWPEQFHGRSLGAFLWAAQMGVPTTTDWVYPSQSCPLVSPVADEEKIGLICQAIDKVLLRCLDSVESTAPMLLCWLCSYSQKFWPKPLKSHKRPATRRAYVSLMKRILCFLCRTWRTPSRKRRMVFHVPIDKSQRRILRQIWSNLDKQSSKAYERGVGYDEDFGWQQQRLSSAGSQRSLCSQAEDSDTREDEDDEEDEEEDQYYEEKQNQNETTDDDSSTYSDTSTDGDEGLDDDDDFSMVDRQDQQVPENSKYKTATRFLDTELCEVVFELCVSLFTTTSASKKPQETFLGYCLGVLGIRQGSKTFYEPYSYTPILAKINWLGRVVLLEYALPQYPYLTWECPGRDSYPDHLRRLQEIRYRYLMLGCGTPLAESFSLKAYGRKIAQVEPGRCQITWSADFQTLAYQGKSISMTGFRDFARNAITQARAGLEGLLQGFYPKQTRPSGYIDLSIYQDTFTQSDVGYSFLSEPVNRLQHSHLDFRQHLQTLELSKMVKRQSYIEHGLRFLEQASMFLRPLCTAIHVTGGQPGRGSELMSIKWRNGQHALRNVYIYDGCVLVLIKYNKSRASTNRSFWVARFLPPAVGQILFIYLVYIRPVVESIIQDLLQRQVSTDFLFTDLVNPQLCRWSSSFVSSSLRESSKTTSIPFTLSSYRHISIGIVRQHVKPIAKPFNLYDDRSTSADITTAVFSWQSSHRPLQGASTYGLNSAFPTTLQPELLNAYRAVSLIWQKWLEISSLPHSAASEKETGSVELSTPLLPPRSLNRKRKRESRTLSG